MEEGGRGEERSGKNEDKERRSGRRRVWNGRNQYVEDSETCHWSV